MRKIIIVTSSYGENYIKRIGGQVGVLSLIKQSGADGVEIRRELLTQTELITLAQLSQEISKIKLYCVYSVPFPLFISKRINSQLRQYFAEASELNAKLIKFSLGDFQHSDEAIFVLKKVLCEYPEIKLVVENDQKKNSGSLVKMKHFADWIRQDNLPITLAFDTGNWVWTNENVQTAANVLAEQIGYIHVKSTSLNLTGEPIAVPPKNEDDEYLKIAKQFSQDVWQGIEFPLVGDDLIGISSYFVNLLKGQ